MNDEIKEILEDLDNEECYINNEIILTFDEAKTLLDYITNLQQENERLNSQLDFIGEQNKYIDRLEKEYKNKVDEIGKLTSKIYKASKYINKNKHLSMFADCREPEEDWNYDLECSANDLLNILQNGSDDNE